jgi:molybdopterin converting factor subunit 1
MTSVLGLRDNGATVADERGCEKMTQHANGTREIVVEYYALLREERGLSQEVVETPAATPRQLYEVLQQKHHFSLSLNRLKVAVNNEFAHWDVSLNSGDSVVFIPPVAGG